MDTNKINLDFQNRENKFQDQIRI
ncbi:hypothetical protein PUN28_002768 [Cardiocondyla obscurior]|uniref:Uncharacterized protein n=1 Tax=Cardiocondyla obscurior TaxID=286306 RepID=A0AAW2GVY2_9HYME